jgi:hypothetical protein
MYKTGVMADLDALEKARLLDVTIITKKPQAPPPPETTATTEGGSDSAASGSAASTLKRDNRSHRKRTWEKTMFCRLWHQHRDSNDDGGGGEKQRHLFGDDDGDNDEWTGGSKDGDRVRNGTRWNISKKLPPLQNLPGGILLPFAVVTALLLSALVFPTLSQEVPVTRVAFLGNSITFVNDLPRFMEEMSLRRIQQDSCLHGSLNFVTLTTKGNGMYNKWQTVNAIMDTWEVEIEQQEENEDNKNGGDDFYEAAGDDAYDKEGEGEEVKEEEEEQVRTETVTIYDYGKCSFPQLLFGYDATLSEGNHNGAFVDDGMNPCFQDPYYLSYLHQQHRRQGSAPAWDVVVMNDQTLYPGIVRKRKKSLRVLKQVYTDLFLESGARPVFLVTYAYQRDYSVGDDDDDNNNDDDSVDDDVTSQLGDIPEFTSRIYYGYLQYAEKLASALPEHQQPVLAPVGLAFLYVYEENRDMWEMLFYDDGFHSSPHGTYLMGCVLYATLYGRMPSSTVKLDQLWNRARRMQHYGMGEDKPLPTKQEAAYLRLVAERVALQGHRPLTLLDPDVVAQMEEYEANNSNNGRK